MTSGSLGHYGIYIDKYPKNYHKWPKPSSKIYQNRSNMGPKITPKSVPEGVWGALGGSWGGLGGGSWGGLGGLGGHLGPKMAPRANIGRKHKDFFPFWGAKLGAKIEPKSVRSRSKM